MEIRIKDVTKKFKDKTVIKQMSFVIESGSFTTLLGPSGCGKTTLLRMIAGLETPDAGEIYFDDRCVFSIEKKINVPPEARGLGFVFQDFTSSFTQISTSLMAAGQVFGGKPFYIFRKITLPLIAKGIATGWMMTFIIAFRELVTASLIAPPNTLVVSTYIVREFEQGSVSVGMAMAVLCVLFSTTALLILNSAIDKTRK